MATNSVAEIRIEPIGKPVRIESPVSQDLLWKDRIKKEVAAANKNLHLAPTVRRTEADKYRETKNRLGFTSACCLEPPYFSKRNVKKETPATSDLQISVPKTSNNLIGWLVSHPAFKYEVNKDFHPKGDFYRNMHWPMNRGF